MDGAKCREGTCGKEERFQNPEGPQTPSATLKGFTVDPIEA